MSCLIPFLFKNTITAVEQTKNNRLQVLYHLFYIVVIIFIAEESLHLFTIYPEMNEQLHVPVLLQICKEEKSNNRYNEMPSYNNLLRFLGGVNSKEEEEEIEERNEMLRYLLEMPRILITIRRESFIECLR